jgi:hypothetical protein
MAAGLWIGGFLKAEELAVLQRVARARRKAAPAPSDTTELAGEIVATDIPEPEPDLVEQTAPRNEKNEERVR